MRKGSQRTDHDKLLTRTGWAGNGSILGLIGSSDLLPAVRQTFRLPTLRKPARFSEVPPLHRPFISRPSQVTFPPSPTTPIHKLDLSYQLTTWTH